MSEIWADMDDLDSFLMAEEFEVNNFQAMNGGENTVWYDNGGGVNTTLYAGGGDGFFPSNYPVGQFSPNPNSSSLCPNTTKQTNVGLVDRVDQPDGAAQSQPPQEDIQDVPPEKKRRITMEQVQRLEESFDGKNRLEPNKKDQLAEELGLNQKQVEVSFQNQQSRSKDKQLQAEYYTLKNHYDSLKADYDRLFMDTQMLNNEASVLSNEIKLTKEEVNRHSMNGFRSSVEGNELLVKPGLPTLEEDPFKGIEPPSMEFVFGFGQS